VDTTAVAVAGRVLHEVPVNGGVDYGDSARAVVETTGVRCCLVSTGGFGAADLVVAQLGRAPVDANSGAVHGVLGRDRGVGYPKSRGEVGLIAAAAILGRGIVCDEVVGQCERAGPQVNTAAVAGFAVPDREAIDLDGRPGRTVDEEDLVGSG